MKDLIAAAIATLLLAAPAVAAETKEPVKAPTEIHMSRAEFLSSVNKLLNAGKFDQAEAIVRALPDEGPLAFDKQFILARIARALGDQRTAEDIYRGMLSKDPNLHRVRLDGSVPPSDPSLQSSTASFRL